MKDSYRDKLVISIGGFLVVPNKKIDTEFLKKFNNLIRKRLAEDKNLRFFLIVGGGFIARHYRNAGRRIIGWELTRDDLDWLGVHTTKLNAHLIRTIFRDLAHPYIIKHYEIIRKTTEPIVVASGWKPGHTTDYEAVLLCEDYKINTILNLGHVEGVYNKNPKKFKDAKLINKISWADFRKIKSNKWTRGLNVPFDTAAAKKAEELGIKVIVLSGYNFDNLERYFRGEKFIGTIITP